MSTVKTIFLQLVTGSVSFSDAITGTGAAMKLAAERAVEYNKIQREVAKQTNIDAVNQSKYKNQIDELLLQSKNRTLSEKERSETIDKALAIEKKAHEEKMSIADKEVKAAELKIAKDNNLTAQELDMLHKKGIEYAYQLKKKKAIDSEDIANLKDKLVKQQEIDNESIQLREKAQNRQDLLDKRAEEKAKAAEEAAKAAREKRLQDIEKAHDLEIKTDENLLALKKQNQKNLNEAELIDPSYIQQRIKI